MDLATYRANSPHPEAARVAQFCAELGAQIPDLRAHIKWNAPSFYLAGGVDVVTFRLNPSPICQLILHLGAKSRPCIKADFPAPKGVLRWAAPDRAVMDFGASDKIALDIAARWLAIYSRPGQPVA